jgi:hypothetical protein
VDVTETPLRDLAEAWHAVTLLGLTSPQAAIATDVLTLLLAGLAIRRGHHRTAATLTAATTAATLWSHTS